MVEIADTPNVLVRNRGNVSPRWLELAYLAGIVPADHIMTRGMFRGLQRRVTAGSTNLSGTSSSRTGSAR